MKSFRKEKSSSILDRRLKAIEKEKAQLNSHIKGLAKQADRQPVIPVSRPEPVRAPRITTTVPNPRAINEPLQPEIPLQREDLGELPKERDHDLFSWSDKGVMNAPVASVDTTTDEAEQEEPVNEEEQTMIPASRPTPPDRRLANYLTSGSFSPSGYKRTPRPIQRNKFIFITILVIVILFVALKLLRIF